MKLLCCQVLNVPYQSLYGTSEFYLGKPIRALTGNEELKVEDINRDVLSRLLDAIAEFGHERLFLRCSQAVASINSEAVKVTVENSTYYVICTNDTERKWTMKELLSIYKKQSVVERNRRCIKDKRLLVNTLYLESPSRINALMWVMTLALLIYSATEYLMRKKMEEQRLTVPTPDHKNVLSRPSLMRVYQYIANSNISLTYSPGTEFVRLTGVPLDMQQILLSMGEKWCRYYISDIYRPYIASAV